MRACWYTGGMLALLLFGGGAAWYRYVVQERVGADAPPSFRVLSSQEEALAPISLDRFFVGAELAWSSQEEIVSTDVCPHTGQVQPLLLLPHYAPVGKPLRQTVQAWRACAGWEPRRLVILSPDHRRILASGFGVGTSLYRLGEREWSTHLQDREALRRLAGQDLGEELGAEHGIGVPLAMLLDTFPRAESVVPIVISSRATQEELLPLERQLRVWMQDSSTLVVLSADFAHYIDLERAQMNDARSQVWLERGMADAFWGVGDAYTDHGRGIWLMGRLAGSSSWYRYAHKTSVDVGGSPQEVSTFFFGWWIK